MKYKRIKAALLCLLPMLLPAVQASADAWIPPDDRCNYYLMSCPYSDGDCKGLNTFLSNYAEANIYFYGSDSDDSVAIAGVLKHIELNGKAERTFLSDSGLKYMEVSPSVFENACVKYFGRSISASSCPGYNDGKIIVSAENYKAPLSVFASSVSCDYEGDDIYSVSFEVYKCGGNAGDYYGVACDNLPPVVKKIGSGKGIIEFSGDQESFRSSDFKLKNISMTNSDPQYTNENTGYTVKNEPKLAEKDKPEPAAQDKQSVNGENSSVVTEKPAKTEKKPDEGNKMTKKPNTAKSNTDTDVIDSRSGRPSGTGILLIALICVLLAALAFTAILLLYKKKRS